MVNVQTHFEKYPLPPWGRRRRRRQEILFKQMFENGPCLAHPISKIAIPRFFFSKFHHLVGDASYQAC